ncbi:MAG: hypothetical protein S4CHLAM37_02400 [Chlamydiia bacterium]|nr:hypothetical protein [Chlamydiia bacterium]
MVCSFYEILLGCIMKRYFLKTLMAVGLIITTGSFLVAEEKPQSLQVTEQFAKQASYAAGDLVSKSNLDPFFPSGKFEFQYIGFCTDFVQDESEMTLFLHAQLITEKNSPYVLFALDVNKADWKINEVSLLSIGDTAVSPRLFCDIIMNPFFSYDAKLTELRDGENTHVHIKTEEKVEEAVVQTWTFFDENESCDFTVILESDGEGGTRYTLERF